MGIIVRTWGAWTDFTLTAASLASDTNLLAGRAGTAVDLSASNIIKLELAGQITTGTSPTAGKVIEIWPYSDISGTPAYPDGITGTDANKTITSADIKYAALGGDRVPQGPAALLATDATSNRSYVFNRVYLEAPPNRLGLFVVHNTGVALNSTGGNHFLRYRALYYTFS